jgi:hypothetical protein
MHYIIYDAALNGLYSLLVLQRTYPHNISLFKGTKDETMVDVAPYLFLIDESFDDLEKNDPEFSLKNILHIESDQTVAVLQQHFKEFIYQKVDRRICYFRCWDPRVLKKFFPNCTDAQLRMFFAPVKKFYAADEDGKIVEYTRDQYKLKTAMA